MRSWRQPRHNCGMAKAGRLSQQSGNALGNAIGFLRRDTAPDFAAIASHHRQCLVEPDIAASHQQTEDVRVIALETLAQQIRRRLMIDANDQKCALAYPMS